MTQENNILNLCESCITALRNTLNSDIPPNISLPLQQRLFLLETAFDDFKGNHYEHGNITEGYLKESDNNLKQAVESFEKDIIRDAIAKQGSKRKAAAFLGSDHSTLIKKCQRYGI